MMVMWDEVIFSQDPSCVLDSSFDGSGQARSHMISFRTDLARHDDNLDAT